MRSLSRKISAIETSATLDITAKAKKMAREGVDVISFGAGEPDFGTPDHIKRRAVRAIEEEFTKYTPSSGTPELKEAIVAKFKSDNGLDYRASQIVVSCGAKHSLFNIFQAILNDGDEVIIPSPYWVSYPEMVKAQGGVPVFVDTPAENGFKPTARLVEEKISLRTKAFVLNSPSNPTGCVYGREELAFIASLAAKHDFYVVSDEIYEKLVYGGKRHLSIASLGREAFERTVIVNGVSKSYSMTGWRIGYAAGPADVMGAISNLQSHATSNPTSISQAAALEALSGPQACVERMRKEFEKRRDFIVRRIRSIAPLDCVTPDGAFYVFVDISRLTIASAELASRLLEEAHVAVVPGGAFGRDDYVRLSFATSLEKITCGLDRIEAWMKGKRI